jgi:tripartite ATP-independent transporter DctM subunit
MSALTIGWISLLLMVVLICAGMQVAIALLLLSLVGVWLIKGNLDTAMSLLAQASIDSIASYDFGVVPLFVLMGLLVAVAGIGKDVFDVADRLFRRVRGGLGIATVAANAGFAATTGISIASAAVFTRVAVPEMLRFGYGTRFAVGVVAGSSVLGMLIPPSLLMILYAFLAEQSVGSMFIAGVIPGLLLAVIYGGGIWAMARFWPSYVGGRLDADRPAMPAREVLSKLLPIGSLVVLVLGGLYGGFFTATEGGAVGALGALLIALARRQLDRAGLWRVLTETGQITVSVLFLIISANLYSRMLSLSGLPQSIVGAMAAAEFGIVAFMALYLLIVLLLGCILDSGSIMLIVLPLMLPVARSFGIDLIWFGVITVVAVEIGLLTPPFGLSVYVVKSTLNDPRVGLADIFAGTFPFTLMMTLALLILIAFPWLSRALL